MKKYLRLFSKQLITEKSENIPTLTTHKSYKYFWVTRINLKKKNLYDSTIKIKG